MRRETWRPDYPAGGGNFDLTAPSSGLVAIPETLGRNRHWQTNHALEALDAESLSVGRGACPVNGRRIRPATTSSSPAHPPRVSGWQLGQGFVDNGSTVSATERSTFERAARSPERARFARRDGGRASRLGAASSVYIREGMRGTAVFAGRPSKKRLCPDV